MNKAEQNKVQDQYEVVIGMETHVQLRTASKLFCGCDNDAREAEPNTKVCPVCAGLPGTLPVLNARAVELAVRAGLALNGKIATDTKFDRKNYFYPDLPKGYQISQFDEPIVGKGYVEFPLNGKRIRVGITRAHLEEDAGKLTHPHGADHSLLDLNRAGTPLLEIVSEPDIRSGAQAKAYAEEIYNLMRYADVSDADLYYGNMRFDVNVSIRQKGAAELGTRAEVKNLNSFRAVERAVEYEFKRQIEVLERGDKVVQETRGWDDVHNRTFSQRSKEEAHDYRYFPEPDLPPLVLSQEFIDGIRSQLPKLPQELRAEMSTAGVNAHEVETLIDKLDLLPLYLHVQELKPGKEDLRRIINWIVGEMVSLLGEGLYGAANAKRDAANLLKLAHMVGASKLSSTAAKTVLETMLTSGDAPQTIAEAKNLLQVSDTAALEKIVKEVLASNQKSVEDYKAGKPQALGFLVGQVMKASKGQANPKMVNELLNKELKK